MFTQSRGHSDIPIYSSYNINLIHLKATVLISQICLKTICIVYMIGSFILSGDSKVMCFGLGVDTLFSHGSGTSSECVKMIKLLQ